MTIYLLDTNVISDLVNPAPNLNVVTQVTAKRNHTIYLSEPVDFEIRRGYLRTSATAKLRIYETKVSPRFRWIGLETQDWRLAAQYWADTVNRGKQLSDIDLLIAALATRLDAVLVSADVDFDALPIRREDWRKGDTAP